MYRAYWAIPRTLKTRAGELSNTSFGMASMLLAILSQEKPDALLLCFDEGEETFRHEQHDEYKEGRAETPDDFYDQIPRVMELVDAFGFARVSDSKYEADDFLGTYAKEGEHHDMHVTIVTGDRDAFQLASEMTRIAIPHKGYHQAEYLGPDEIFNKYGIRPDQVASYKGLCGDSSDNLKGVSGIGPKTAASLLQTYDSLDGIYGALEGVKPSVREKLERDRDQAYFCQKMAELVCDIPLPYSLEEISLTGLDPEPLLSFFSEMEFSLLSKRFLKFLESEYGKQHFEADALPTIEVAEKNPAKSKTQLSLFD